MFRNSRIHDQVALINLAMPPIHTRILMPLFCCLLVWTSNAAGQQSPSRKFAWSTFEMGVKLEFTVYCDSVDQADAAIREATENVQRCNQVFSDYLDSSEVMSLSRHANHGWQPVSDELFQLIKRSRSIHEVSRGGFDVTLGALTQLWRQSRKSGRLPERAELESALACSGMSKLESHSAETSIRIPEGMRLDFGGIAKGFAADLALATLSRHGIDSAMVDLGGDLAIGKAPPGKKGWQIAIASLHKSADHVRYVIVEDCGIATSGDREQYLEIDGQRYSHILDPRTGLGVRKRSSVTVIGPDATTADGYASAFSVLPLAETRLVVSDLPRIGYLIQVAEQDDVREYRGGMFPEILEWNADSK